MATFILARNDNLYWLKICPVIRSIRTCCANNAYDLALEAIRKEEHYVYLFDYRLGEYTGLGLLKAILDLGINVPVIFLAGQNDENIDLQAMKAGASDFLVKESINATLLERSS